MTQRSTFRFAVLVFCCASFVSMQTANVSAEETILVSSESRRLVHPKPIELIGVVRLDGHAVDASGLHGKLEDGSMSNQFGGFSGMDYSGDKDRFFLLSDRGAGDGAVSYPCRFHEVNLKVDPATKQIQFDLLATRLLTSQAGSQVVGSLAAHDNDLHAMGDSHDWTAMDPEGIRCLPGGALLMSDEYGPHIVIVDPSGQIETELAIPGRFRIQLTEDGTYRRGTFPNRGLEGIAVTPSGKRFVSMLQSPLIQDGKIEDHKCFGLNCRGIILDATAKDHDDGEEMVEHEFDYRLDSFASGTSEILAVDETRFLVIERDGQVGEAAKCKRIYLIDTAKATDVCQLESMPSEEIPANVLPATKTLLIDLLDPAFGIGGALAVEKPEGLCWGKPLEDGRRTLWVCCDNDFDVNVKSEIYCFAIAGTAL
ncbi:hypothetical protein CA13_11960 [Planctomycetes bacterium CA13]|uniref:Phytase-like domain-containing protein n=1 Tax=Novipirellula herctigrandis TaxID=2527986 RepID=A0A5C5YXJ4_9BACT|nr:hypothetical protein CA13_11960 [Planctomycetes bacterium CA13]